MIDFAKLVMLFDTSSAAKAKSDLKDIASQSEKTEKQVEKSNREIQQSNDRTGRSFSGLSSVVIKAFTAIGAALSIGKFISATAEAGENQAQLAAAIRSTGMVAGQTVGELNKHAAALQGMTKFEDDAITSAQALLLTFTKIRGDVFPKATEAVLNVATAMKTDLKSAAIQVGKALNSPKEGLTALSRSGIQFSQSQKDMIATMVDAGDIVGAQTIILKELETQFGGSARAARETFGGAMAALANTIGNLFEVAPRYVEPLRLAIEGLITAISNPGFQQFAQVVGGVVFKALELTAYGLTVVVNLIGFMTENIGVVMPLVQTLGVALAIMAGPAILIAIQSVTLAIGVGMVGAVRAVTVAMLANPLGALVVGISAALVAIYHFRDEIKQAIGVDVVGIAYQAANLFIGSFVAAYTDIKFVWMNFPDIIGGAAIGAVNHVIRSINVMVSMAKGSINALIDAANNIPGVDIGRVDTETAFAQQIDNPYAGRLASSFQQRNSDIDAAMSQDYIGRIRKVFETASPKPFSPQGSFTVPKMEIEGSTGALEDNSKTADDVCKAIKAIGDASSSTFAGGLTPAVQQAAASMDALKTAGEFVGDTLSGWFDQALDGTFKFKSALRDLAKQLASSSFKSLIGGVLNGGTKAGGGNFIASLIGGVFGGLPSFAVGADRVPNDMVAKIHKNEMIVPEAGANAIRSGGLGGATTVFNISANNSDRAAIEGLKRTLAGLIKNQQRSTVASFKSQQRLEPGFG